MRRIPLLLLAALLASIATDMPLSAEPKSWTDDEIRNLLAERVDVDRRSVGIVVGLIEPEGKRIVTYGRRAKNDPRPLDGDTLFEIGSVTKVFTALLLADMAQRREVSLDDPVAKFLPLQVSVPERNGRKISLRDLSVHMSGLPRLPTNLDPSDPSNPYLDYTAERLYTFLSIYQIPREVGVTYEYSNLGVGLLGHVLARRAGSDYETALRTRILDRLRLDSTRIKLTPEMTARLATGHNADLEPTPNWDFDAIAGAGALRSSANDLLRFLAAAMGESPPDLAQALAAILQIRLPTGVPNMDVGLGWHFLTQFDDEIVAHGGGTGGYQSYVAYSTKSRRGVVVLSNSQGTPDIFDIARHLLNASYPLAILHREIATKPALLQAYVGRYRLTPTEIFTITREEDRLFAQLTAQKRYGLYAESDRKYFYKVVNAQITFVLDDQGKAPQLILHQNGKDQIAERIAE